MDVNLRAMVVKVDDGSGCCSTLCRIGGWDLGRDVLYVVLICGYHSHSV